MSQGTINTIKLMSIGFFGVFAFCIFVWGMNGFKLPKKRAMKPKVESKHDFDCGYNRWARVKRTRLAEPLYIELGKAYTKQHVRDAIKSTKELHGQDVYLYVNPKEHSNGGWRISLNRKLKNRRFTISNQLMIELYGKLCDY